MTAPCMILEIVIIQCIQVDERWVIREKGLKRKYLAPDMIIQWMPDRYNKDAVFARYCIVPHIDRKKRQIQGMPKRLSD